MNSNKDDILNSLIFCINQISEDLEFIKKINSNIFFELTKEEIINYFEYTLTHLNNWQEYFKSENYNKIIEEYKEVEGIISELELCLVDYENDMKMNMISCTIHELGLFLKNSI